MAPHAGWQAMARRWLRHGGFTETVLAHGFPSNVVGVDPSSDFVQYAAAHVTDPRVSFRVGEAQGLPVDDASFDPVVSGLVLNFVPNRRASLDEMRRAARDAANDDGTSSGSNFTSAWCQATLASGASWSR